jgi:hypothetical protein
MKSLTLIALLALTHAPAFGDESGLEAGSETAAPLESPCFLTPTYRAARETAKLSSNI